MLTNHTCPTLARQSSTLLVFSLGLVLTAFPSASLLARQAAQADSSAGIDFERDVQPILNDHCSECHSADSTESDLNVFSRSNLLRGGESGEPSVNLEQPLESYLLKLTSGSDDLQMPPDATLSEDEQKVLQAWVIQGLKMPVEADEASRTTNHWSFQPIRFELPPGVTKDSSPSEVLDQFIAKQLSSHDLSAAPMADRATLIRRLYLVMHGLPPTPEQIRRFENDRSPSAWDNLVEEVLSSPRYGERWGRHWLDLIRFGETEGFETNRERPNAWPYRDWVIQSLNEDLSYWDFVKHQLAGDALGSPIATGFLVAGPHDIVKSPDINLTLMQRQDELSDLVNTAGTAFMGLTLGCARCHNHKFDPITQRDFYSIQAVFAGVEHGERELPLPQEVQAEANVVLHEIDDVKRRLSRYLPLARPDYLLLDDEPQASEPDAEIAKASVEHIRPRKGVGKNPPGTRPGQASDIGSDRRAGNVSRGSYSWWHHQPGEDFIVYRPRRTGRQQVWVSWGAAVATHSADAQYLLDRDGDLGTRDDQTTIARVNQQLLAEHQTDSPAEGPDGAILWSGFFSAGTHDFERESCIIMRGGDTGTATTADAILLIPATSEEKLKAERIPTPRFRQGVESKLTIDRFPATQARFVRMTILATSGAEPCIDEIEVYSESRNVASRSAGAVPTCSSTLPGYAIHQLAHVNDGLFGNDHSWISNEPGRGWIQIEFEQPYLIDRVEWARDREGRFKDRTPTSYVIESSLDGETWTRLADSFDRLPFPPSEFSLEQSYALTELDRDQRSAAEALLGQLQDLSNSYSRLTASKTVYAGVFRQPEPTHRLYRGDPLAKREVVPPDGLEVLGSLNLDVNLQEQRRRQAFAEWVASPDHPLTSRVIVNRLWQFHFGQGIVATPSDFGANGVAPTHPQLLDWLASQLHENNGSLKSIHRILLHSQTWRQAGFPSKEGLERDASNTLLWRFAPRRLEAEAIRDSMLSASGALDLTMGGPGFDGFEVELENVRHFFPKTQYDQSDFRRMVYMTVVRQERESVFGVFDCPDASQVVAKRSRSTTPLQALNLLNSTFTIDQSRRFADRLRSDVGDDVERQVKRAYMLCYGRSPTSEESAAAQAFIAEEDLEQFSRALLNSNEFLFIP